MSPWNPATERGVLWAWPPQEAGSPLLRWQCSGEAAEPGFTWVPGPEVAPLSGGVNVRQRLLD